MSVAQVMIFEMQITNDTKISDEKDDEKKLKNENE